MDATAPRYRATARALLRDAALDAARELTVARGWDGVRMAEVAARAGVSRQTLYNEFTSRDGLAEALAHREIDRFVAAVRRQLDAHGDDVPAAAHAAILHVLREAAGDPLVKAILSGVPSGAGSLLPFLTTRSEQVLGAASAVLLDWARELLPDADPARLAFGAESIVRLVVSHIVFPAGPVEQTSEALASVAVQLMSGAGGPAHERHGRSGRAG
jgi:AcrR family transcriptional regulator